MLAVWREWRMPQILRQASNAGTVLNSVRVSRDYRAVAVQAEDQMVRFWIGSHADYLRILSSL